MNNESHLYKIHGFREFNRMLLEERDKTISNYKGLICDLWRLRHIDEHTKEALKRNIGFFREYKSKSGSYIGKNEAQRNFLKAFK